MAARLLSRQTVKKGDDCVDAMGSQACLAGLAWFHCARSKRLSSAKA